MERILPLLFILIATGIVALVIGSALQQSNRLKDSFRQLANRSGGMFHDGGWFGTPSVTFYHGSLWVRVEVISTGGKNKIYYTQLRTAWSDASFRCEVYPEGLFQRIGKFLGMGDIQIGSPQFDRDYLISSNSPPEIRSALSPAAQTLLNQLRNFAGNREIYLNITGGRYLVKKRGRLSELATLDMFVDLSLQLYDAMHAYQEGGIEFVESAATDEQQTPVCQICGEEIVTDQVDCALCRTPHHRECWQYYGACSTYGCGGKKYV